MTFQLNNHEEADTLMICLAASASQRNPSAKLVFFSPHTYVVVLAVANYDQLRKTRPFSWYQRCTGDRTNMESSGTREG